MSDPVKKVASPLNAVYEKYKHLDGCLSDTEWCNAGIGAIYPIAGELWRAVKEARENPCDEICQHSRIYSPIQMQQAIAQATEAENKRVLDEFSRAWRSGSCPNPMAPCSMDDGKIYCPICIAETLRLAQPKPTEREPE